MLAARYLGLNRIEPVEVRFPKLAAGDALVKVEACGFCGSDLGIVGGFHPRAKAPLTLGHEFCGTIAEQSGATSHFRVGDRVAAWPLIPCGRCFACLHGAPHVCRALRLYGIDIDGGMAEYARVPAASLLPLPGGMTPQIGALIEPLAVAVHGVSLAPARAPRTTVVMGAGPIGLLTALIATARGDGMVLVSDTLPSRRALASRLGLRAVAAGEELRHAVEAETAGEGADVLFECTGAPAAARDMTELVRPQATIVNLGVFKKPTEVDLQAVNFKELSIVGSRVYSREQFEEAISMAAGLPLDQIVTHTFPLEEASQAFEHFRQGADVCKILIVPGDLARPV
jgi:2-desacetyl-2-hydroxyethyl bacteriochlorophyllide A dehydrogenase